MKKEEMKNYKAPVVKVVEVHIESAILVVSGRGKDGEDDGEI